MRRELQLAVGRHPDLGRRPLADEPGARRALDGVEEPAAGLDRRLVGRPAPVDGDGGAAGLDLCPGVVAAGLAGRAGAERGPAHDELARRRRQRGRDLLVGPDERAHPDQVEPRLGAVDLDARVEAVGVVAAEPRAGRRAERQRQVVVARRRDRERAGPVELDGGRRGGLDGPEAAEPLDRVENVRPDRDPGRSGPVGVGLDARLGHGVQVERGVGPLGVGLGLGGVVVGVLVVDVVVAGQALGDHERGADGVGAAQERADPDGVDAARRVLHPDGRVAPAGVVVAQDAAVRGLNDQDQVLVGRGGDPQRPGPPVRVVVDGRRGPAGVDVAGAHGRRVGRRVQVDPGRVVGPAGADGHLDGAPGRLEAALGPDRPGRRRRARVEHRRRGRGAGVERRRGRLLAVWRQGERPQPDGVATGRRAGHLDDGLEPLGVVVARPGAVGAADEERGVEGRAGPDPEVAAAPLDHGVRRRRVDVAGAPGNRRLDLGPDLEPDLGGRPAGRRERARGRSAGGVHGRRGLGGRARRQPEGEEEGERADHGRGAGEPARSGRRRPAPTPALSARRCRPDPAGSSERWRARAAGGSSRGPAARHRGPVGGRQREGLGPGARGS